MRGNLDKGVLMPSYVEGRVIVFLSDNLTENKAKELILEGCSEGLKRPRRIFSGDPGLFTSCILHVLDVEPGSENAWVRAMTARGYVSYRKKEKMHPAVYRKTHILLRN